MTLKESFSSLSQSFRRTEELFNGPLWVTNLKKERNRLIDHHINNTLHVYQSIEVYQDRANPTAHYARINLPPTNNHLQTLVVGNPESIGRYAKHDIKLVEPIPDELLEKITGITQLAPVLNTTSDLSYYVRPSSFALDKVEFQRLFDQDVKLVVMRYMLGGKRNEEFFAHIHTANEEDWLFPEHCRAILLTNSAQYIGNHPEHTYFPIDFQQIQNAASNGLII